MAKTEFFQRLEDWRRSKGRRVATTSYPSYYRKKRASRPAIAKPNLHRPLKHDDYFLTILALRIASQHGREDLRPEYDRIADAMLHGSYPRPLCDGDGI